MRPATQLSLFDATSARPAPPPRSHHTWVKNGVVHVHLASGELYSEDLPRGPLTRGECSEWESPCNLMKCRYRLDPRVVARTRRPEYEEAPDEDRELDEYEGPRTRIGTYYADTELDDGVWCALTVAEQGGRGEIRDIDENVSLAELAVMYGVSREGAHKMVESALAELNMEDIYAQRELYSLWDKPVARTQKVEPVLFHDKTGGRTHVHFGVVYPTDASIMRITIHDSVRIRADGLTELGVGDDNLTDAEVRRIKVPGPAIPRGIKVVPTMRRRPRKDPWVGVVRRVPAEFADRVNEKLMNQLQPNDRIPAALMKPLRPPTRRVVEER